MSPASWALHLIRREASLNGAPLLVPLIQFGVEAQVFQSRATFCVLRLLPSPLLLAGWSSAQCQDAINDWHAGLNGGWRERLASVVDLVRLKMALDHSDISPPLPN